MSKKFYFSKTINFFTLVALGGGLDIIDTLARQEVIDWRSVVLAAIGVAGIALRINTTEAVKF